MMHWFHPALCGEKKKKITLKSYQYTTNTSKVATSKSPPKSQTGTAIVVSNLNIKTLHVWCHFVLYLETWHQRLSTQTVFVWQYAPLTFCLQTQQKTCRGPKLFLPCLKTQMVIQNKKRCLQSANANVALHHKGLVLVHACSLRAHQHVTPELHNDC